MTTHITYHDAGWRCYGVTASGRGRLFAGCTHGNDVRAAIAHSDALDAAPREEPRQPVSPAERDATLAVSLPASAGALRGASPRAQGESFGEQFAAFPGPHGAARDAASEDPSLPSGTGKLGGAPPIAAPTPRSAVQQARSGDTPGEVALLIGSPEPLAAVIGGERRRPGVPAGPVVPLHAGPADTLGL